MAWTTVTRAAGTQYQRIRPAGFQDAGEETAPHLFCTSHGSLAVIAMWQWTDAGRPDHMPLTIDTFELVRDTVLISLHAGYGYEQLEAGLAASEPAGFRPSIRHTPGDVPDGDNRMAAAWISGPFRASGAAVDGWHEAPEVCSCIEEVMLVRGTLRRLATQETTMDDYMRLPQPEECR